MKRPVLHHDIHLTSLVGGGQAIGTLPSGKKIFAWGALPGEVATIQQTKRKSSYAEGIAIDITNPSPERTTPRDAASYLSTSPWQIMAPERESHYKAALIEEAFELHNIVLPDPITVQTDGQMYEYRNKVEFSWWWDTDKNQLDLAFFKRGSKGKVPVDGTSLARANINHVARQVRDILRQRGVEARALKTVLLRCDQAGRVTAGLYVKEEDFPAFTPAELRATGAAGVELIYSNPKSPASVLTTQLQSWGTCTLTDTILGVPFCYTNHGFFQVNVPLYEQALRYMQPWVTEPGAPVVDMYAGVGSIGLTIGGDDVTLIELNPAAVQQMNATITELGRQGSATAVLAASEQALDYIQPGKTIIVDPPRAGLHTAVIERLLATRPPRIVYLSCNPVTQARDVALLAAGYGIRAHQGFNFFPRTPHIEHVVVLDRKK